MMTEAIQATKLRNRLRNVLEIQRRYWVMEYEQ